MTPQERQLIDELFDRLAKLERQPRDPEAERAIAEGLARAPHALYPLVQTVLVQDEALRRADGRIRELESELGIQPGQGSAQGSFPRRAVSADRARHARASSPRGRCRRGCWIGAGTAIWISAPVRT